MMWLLKLASFTWRMRFDYIVGYVRNPSLLTVELFSVMFMHHASSTGHVGCHQFNAVVNIRVQVSKINSCKWDCWVLR